MPPSYFVLNCIPQKLIGVCVLTFGESHRSCSVLNENIFNSFEKTERSKTSASFRVLFLFFPLSYIVKRTEVSNIYCFSTWLSISWNRKYDLSTLHMNSKLTNTVLLSFPSRRQNSVELTFHFAQNTSAHAYLANFSYQGAVSRKIWFVVISLAFWSCECEKTTRLIYLYSRSQWLNFTERNLSFALFAHIRV